LVAQQLVAILFDIVPSFPLVALPRFGFDDARAAVLDFFRDLAARNVIAVAMFQPIPVGLLLTCGWWLGTAAQRIALCGGRRLLIGRLLAGLGNGGRVGRALKKNGLSLG